MNLKETELRLGLPGSESPEKKSVVTGVSIFGKDFKDEAALLVKNSSFVSGAKRGFSDAINGSHKWVLSMSGGGSDDEADLDKKPDGLLFSPRGTTTVAGGPAKMKDTSPVELEKKGNGGSTSPAAKAQVVGWPPVRSFHKNTLSKHSSANGKSGSGCLYVKVSMDGAPYLRKIDLKTYSNYAELSTALEKMFSCFTIGQCGDGLAGKEHLSESRLRDLLHRSEYVLTYEDKDGDWMLVGDVPWEMFTDSCKRLRIMKGSDAIGLAPRTVQKCKSQN